MRNIHQFFQYLKTIWYKFRITMKEFYASNKKNKESYRSFVDSGLLVDVHSVEKGLGLKNTEPGHSSKGVVQLIDRLNGYIDREFGTDSFAFRETFRVIDEYISFQRKYDVSQFPEFAEIEKLFGKLCDRVGNDEVELIRKEFSAGSKVINKKTLEKGKEFDFYSFISSRHSMRMYDDRSVSTDDIKSAVEISNQAPSACNRQPTSVYFCNEPSKVNKVDDLITGSIGFKGETPNYILVTTDRACFSKEEQFQWYINGGIYVSFLVLALHSLGIGTCIMQWKAFYKTEVALKKVCGVKDSEAIIAVIGCGYYTDNTKCIIAQRKKPDETLHIV